MDDARLRFLFGRVLDPDRYDDEPDRLDLLEQDRPDGRSALRGVIANQVLDDDPPLVWETATRLLDAGLHRYDAMDQLVIAVRPMIMAALDGGTAFGDAEYAAALDRLPLPSAAEVAAVYVAVAREARVLPIDELEERVAERFGLAADDPVTESLLGDVDRDLYESVDSPLAMLPSDLVVHLPALAEGAVLTHRLSAAEQAEGTLELLPDLAAFARTSAPRAGGHDLRLEEGRWRGPADWLADVSVGGLVAVTAQEDGEVSVAALDDVPEPTADLVAAVRAVYDVAVEEPGVPVNGEDLLAGLLHRDAAAFAAPRPPLSELAAAAGLQQRGDEFAHEEAVWRRGEDLGRYGRLMARLGADARTAMEAYALLADESDDPVALREALDLMGDPEILEAVVEELLDHDAPERVRHLVGLADRLVTVAGRSVRGAVASAVAAIAAERDGRPLDAESHLRNGARLGDSWEFVEDRLAWYASDRGAAAEARARWEAIGVPRSDPDLAALLPFAATAAAPELGRNEPCWCGSGRKFKQCHRGKVEQAPLPDRVDWLARKSVAYLVRRGGIASAIAPYLAARYAEGDEEPALDPLTVDVALVEGGLFARFVAERGALLPPDELLLAQAWVLVERSVYEVLDVDPGRGATVRDLRTGDELTVRDFGAVSGERVCARFVPDGVGHRLVGARFRVDPGRERQVLALLDDADGLGLLEEVAASAAGPRVVSVEGDDLMLCTAVVTVPDGAAAMLDKLFEPTDEGWVWSADVDGDARIFANLAIEGDQLVAATITERRMDTLLALLAEAFPGCVVVMDRREQPDHDAPAAQPGVPPDPAVVEEVLGRMERRWCEEPVPALDGMRPRDAVDDPTRRDDVARLIASFPEVDPATGAFGLRPDRLRELLGLS